MVTSDTEPISISGLLYLETDDRKRLVRLNDWLSMSANFFSPFVSFYSIIVAGIAVVGEAYLQTVLFVAAGLVAAYMGGIFRKAAHYSDLRRFERDTSATIAMIYQAAAEGERSGSKDELELPRTLEGFIPDIQDELKFKVSKAYSHLNYAKGLLFAIGILASIGFVTLSDRTWLLHAGVAAGFLTVIVDRMLPR